MLNNFAIILVTYYILYRFHFINLFFNLIYFYLNHYYANLNPFHFIYFYLKNFYILLLI